MANEFSYPIPTGNPTYGGTEPDDPAADAYWDQLSAFVTEYMKKHAKDRGFMFAFVDRETDDVLSVKVAGWHFVPDGFNGTLADRLPVFARAMTMAAMGLMDTALIESLREIANDILEGEDD